MVQLKRGFAFPSVIFMLLFLSALSVAYLSLTKVKVDTLISSNSIDRLDQAYYAAHKILQAHKNESNCESQLYTSSQLLVESCEAYIECQVLSTHSENEDSEEIIHTAKLYKATLTCLNPNSSTVISSFHPQVDSMLGN